MNNIFNDDIEKYDFIKMFGYGYYEDWKGYEYDAEQEIVQTLKKLGYEYKKPYGNKLHFFNKKTSISVYLDKTKGQITPIP